MKQLEFWRGVPEPDTTDERRIPPDTSPAIEEDQIDFRRDVANLLVNPDRQNDYGGVPHGQWPAPEVNRDSITVDRIRNDIDGPAHRFEIRRHDFVEVFIDHHEVRFGHVVGISNERQEVRIAFQDDEAETWFDTACVFASPSREAREAPSVQEQVARRIQTQTQYTSIKIVSLVRVGSMKGRHRLTSTHEACDFFRRYWIENPSADQERFVIACCDTKHAVQSVVMITQGTLDASLVHPREVFRPAILESSSAICLSHNHPSGDPTPSREDHAVTKQLTDAGKLLGINVLDHVVFADGTNEAVSLREC